MKQFNLGQVPDNAHREDAKEEMPNKEIPIKDCCWDWRDY